MPTVVDDVAVLESSVATALYELPLFLEDDLERERLPCDEEWSCDQSSFQCALDGRDRSQFALNF